MFEAYSQCVSPICHLNNGHEGFSICICSSLKATGPRAWSNMSGEMPSGQPWVNILGKLNDGTGIEQSHVPPFPSNKS